MREPLTHPVATSAAKLACAHQLLIMLIDGGCVVLSRAASGPYSEQPRFSNSSQRHPLIMPITVHIPVMLEPAVRGLDAIPGKLLVDGTLGGGGHSRRLAEMVAPGGKVIAVDRDPQAVARTEATLAGLPIQTAVASYDELPEVLAQLGVQKVDGILLDLGLSSDQLFDDDRGFSYGATGALDLRFDPNYGEPAWQLLQHISEHDLADLIYRYGEERLSRRIAKRIVETRRTAPIKTAAELADLVRRCVPRSKNHRIDPATRTFQALRIAVNDELVILERALHRLPDILNLGGRLVIISFHSLEDRLVKNAFRNDRRLEPLTRKPELPNEQEMAENSRSRSAKMRVAVRVEPVEDPYGF